MSNTEVGKVSYLHLFPRGHRQGEIPKDVTHNLDDPGNCPCKAIKIVWNGEAWVDAVEYEEENLKEEKENGE